MPLPTVADTDASSPVVPPPLEALTNNCSSLNAPNSSFLSPADAERRSPLVVRRQNKLNSSESTILDHDSIYNAELVRSSEDLTGHRSPLKKLQDTWQLPPPIISVKPADCLPPGSVVQSFARPASPPLGHSRWPVPRLDTIAEQAHITKHKASYSGARLRASPERRLHVIKTKYSVESIHPLRLGRPVIPQRRSLKRLTHRRSRSLNDLEELEDDIQVASLQQKRILITSSSSSEVVNLYFSSAFPLQPLQSPPERVQTPPGLPSFGTREAQEYRLTVQPPISRRSRFLNHLFRGSHESEGSNPAGISNPYSPEHRAENKFGLSAVEETLRRIVTATGIPRLISAPRSVSDKPVSSLPPGISTANSPGILAMADDGTPVRGRFGNRASGHGVGSRPLRDHPLTRRNLNDRSGLNEAIREIDKACAQMQTPPEPSRVAIQNGLTSSPDLPAIVPFPGFVPLEKPRFNQSQNRPLVVGGDSITIPNTLAAPSAPSLRLHRPVTSPPPSLRSYRVPASPGQSPSQSVRGASPPLLSAASSMRMQEPRQYAQSLLSVRTAHLMNPVQQTEQQLERDRARQVELTEKLKDHEESFWDKCLRCCCDYDRRGQHMIGPEDYNQPPIPPRGPEVRSPASASDASVMHGGPGVNRFY